MLIKVNDKTKLIRELKKQRGNKKEVIIYFTCPTCMNEEYIGPINEDHLEDVISSLEKDSRIYVFIECQDRRCGYQTSILDPCFVKGIEIRKGE